MLTSAKVNPCVFFEKQKFVNDELLQIIHCMFLLFLIIFFLILLKNERMLNTCSMADIQI